jgi:hypothetical protein
MRMAAWPVHDIAPGCVFRTTRGMPSLAPALDAEISRLWDAAQARLDGKLFNGRVFSADIITPPLVCGHWTEFRRVVAQIDCNALHPVLGIRPLAVGGVVIGPDGVVFGRRPARAIYQADGTVDVVGQLLTELREELGMAADSVRAPRLLGIVEHGGSHVLDLGIALATELPASTIRALHDAHGNAEYGSLEIVPVPRLRDFLAAAGPMLNHQAPVFLRRALGEPRC